MQIIKKKETLGLYCFYVAILIHILIMSVEAGAWSVPYRGRLLQVAFALCAIKIVTTAYSKQEWIAIGALSILSVASYIFSHEKYVIYVVALIFATKAVDLRLILKSILYATVASTLVIVVLSLFGIGGQVVDTRDFGRGVVESRYSLGFSHANNLHGTFWYIIAIFVFLKKDKLVWWHYGILTALNIGLFVLTRSKAAVIDAQLMIVAGIIYKYANKYFFEKLWTYICGVVVYVGILGLSIVSVIIDFRNSGGVWRKIDDFTTGRLNLAYRSAYIKDWRLLSPGGARVDTLDNGWVLLVANYGYLVLIVFVAFVLYLIYLSAKKKDGISLAVIVTTIFYIFMESSYMVTDVYLLRNLLFVIAMYYLIDSKEEYVGDRLQ